MVNCPAAMASGVSASIVARMPPTAIVTSTTTTRTVPTVEEQPDRPRGITPMTSQATHGRTMVS